MRGVKEVLNTVYFLGPYHTNYSKYDGVSSYISNTNYNILLTLESFFS